MNLIASRSACFVVSPPAEAIRLFLEATHILRRFPEHPVCKDNDTWRGVERYLVEHGYVAIEHTSLEEL
jgi:hypothetical protein